VLEESFNYWVFYKDDFKKNQDDKGKSKYHQILSLVVFEVLS
jgi:hypothetical protein